jgi:tetratricopeptide (TPR) repeat protein
MGRFAAALLCGAAAVHLASLFFDAGLAAGLSGFGEGRAFLLLIAVPFGSLAAWICWDRFTGCWAFLAGACLGYAADEGFLLPRLGWTWSTAIWIAAAGFALSWRGRDLPIGTGPGIAARLAGAAVLGIVMGFAFAFVRPFLFQHVNGTRVGLGIAVLTGLLGLLAGAALGQAMKRRLPAWGIATLAAFLAAISFVTTFALFQRASAGMRVPVLSGPWSFTWWGRSILASWAVLGLMTVAFGLALPLLDRRRVILVLLLGLCAGTWLGERQIAGLGSDSASLRGLAERVARHPPLQGIEVAAIDPDGMWTKYRTRTLLELESLAFWQATRMDRGSLWHNLEAAEVEPAGAGQPKVAGHVAGMLGLAEDAGRGLAATSREGADVVLSSPAFLASGLAFRDTVGALKRVRNAGPSCLRVWCDARALTPAGLRSVLATWREALPEGRVSVLIDGYNGPLLGVRVGGEGARFRVADQLAIFQAPIASAFRGELGPPSTFDRPILEWEAAPEPSPFTHPRADVMEALAGILAVDPETAAGYLLRGLVVHARHQVVRPFVVSAWDHVAVPEEEVGIYMAGLAKDPSPALVQHLQIVFDVLYKKREYALLVRHAEEAVARHPDVFAFHRTLGRAYHDILDYGNAVEELTQARALAPDHHDVAMELSRALLAAKRAPEAVALLEDEQRRSSDPAIQKALAISVLEAGDLIRAEALLKEVNTSYPGDLDVMRALDRLERERK